VSLKPRAAAGRNVAPGNATTIDRVLDVLERKGIEVVENGVRLVCKLHRQYSLMGDHDVPSCAALLSAAGHDRQGRRNWPVCDRQRANTIVRQQRPGTRVFLQRIPLGTYRYDRRYPQDQQKRAGPRAGSVGRRAILAKQTCPANDLRGYPLQDVAGLAVEKSIPGLVPKPLNRGQECSRLPAFLNISVDRREAYTNPH